MDPTTNMFRLPSTLACRRRLVLAWWPVLRRSTRGGLPCPPLGEHSRPTFLAASHIRVLVQSPLRSLIAPTGQTGPDMLIDYWLRGTRIRWHRLRADRYRDRCVFE